MESKDKELQHAQNRLNQHRKNHGGFTKQETVSIDESISNIQRRIDDMAEKKRKEENSRPIQTSLDLDTESHNWHEINKELENSGVGKRYIRESLDTFSPKTEKQAAALNWAREYITGNAISEGLGALFLGAPEAGKTHLMCSILKEAVIKKISVGYVTVEDFFIALQSTFGHTGHTEEDVLRQYSKPSLLVLDDLQHIKNADSDWQYKRLWTLLDRRYRNLKATLVSTNLTVNEFQEIIDKRTRRRLEAKVINMGNDNGRASF